MFYVTSCQTYWARLIHFHCIFASPHPVSWLSIPIPLLLLEASHSANGMIGHGHYHIYINDGLVNRIKCHNMWVIFRVGNICFWAQCGWGFATHEPVTPGGNQQLSGDAKRDPHHICKLQVMTKIMKFNSSISILHILARWRPVLKNDAILNSDSCDCISQKRVLPVTMLCDMTSTWT